MTTQAIARLQSELRDLNKNPVAGFKCDLRTDDSMFEWIVHIEGPPDSYYEGGIFKAIMKFPDDYPNSPPTISFVSDFWHPNVYSNGELCISILHTPDPLNTEEKEDECWRPIQTVESILVSCISMLSDPNFSSPANVDASVMLRRHKDKFKQKVRATVEKSLRELPPGFEMPKPKPPKPSITEDDFFDMNDYYDDYDEDYDEDMEDEDCDEECEEEDDDEDDDEDM